MFDSARNWDVGRLKQIALPDLETTRGNLINNLANGFGLYAGVWLLHCHFEMHLSWGMEMAFVVKNGVGVNQTLPPPPHDMPRCKKQKPKRHH
jgi:hypothetical protein